MTYEYAPQPTTPQASSPVVESQPTELISEKHARLNTLAIVSFALSLLSALAVPAVIIGHFALVDLKKSGERGKVLAVLGLVFGYLTIAASILFMVLFFAALGEGIRSFEHQFPEWKQQWDGMQNS